MDKKELDIYIKQFIAILLFYITIMIPIVYTQPKSASMDCNSDYTCTVKMKYIWFLSQSADFKVSQYTKLRFYVSYNNHSGFVNIYDVGSGSSLNVDPFGTDDFYVSTPENAQEQQLKMSNDESRFKEYIENPDNTFSMSKKYDTTRLKLIGGLITLFFMGLSLTKRPLTNFWNIIRIMFTRSRY